MMMPLLSKRTFSSNAFLLQKTFNAQQYIRDPVKLIIIPITTKKSFVYYKHSPDLIDNSSIFIRYETKISNKVSKIWTNMEDSPKGYKKKIVAWVNSLLDQTPWSENSLKTVPSESYILKRVQEKEHEKENKLTLKEYLSKSDELIPKPIHVYYPTSVISREHVLQEFESLWEVGKSYHKKYTIYSILGIPFTLPLVLVPVVPNVPGFYLAYRAYCNFKAYCGAKHLQSLVENENQRLEFINMKEYSDIISTGLKNKPTVTSDEEKMLLDHALLDRVLDNLEIHELKTDLGKAIRQEEKRLLGRH